MPVWSLLFFVSNAGVSLLFFVSNAGVTSLVFNAGVASLVFNACVALLPVTVARLPVTVTRYSQPGMFSGIRNDTDSGFCQHPFVINFGKIDSQRVLEHQSGSGGCTGGVHGSGAQGGGTRGNGWYRARA